MTSRVPAEEMGEGRGPQVSVVMAARDAERTVAQALDSLIAQSFPDWEAILIDDGSTDGSLAILEGYQARDARIRLIRGVGEGASRARNRGIAEARGQWLAFLDADDWITPDFLERALAALAATPDARAAYCPVQRVMPDGRMLARRVDRRLEADAFALFARTCAPVAIHGIVIDGALVQGAGGFDTALMTCEDWDLWQRLSRAGLRWVMTDGPTAFYRVSEGSLSRKTRQLAQDAAIVIGRGFGPDDRVPDALPQNAAGTENAKGEDHAATIAWFTLWNHAVDRAGGGGAPIDADLLKPLDREPASAQALLDTLMECFCLGARLVPDQLAANWDRIGPAFAAITAALQEAWQDDLPVRRLQYRFDRMVLDLDDMAAPRVLSRTMGLRVDALAPPNTPLSPGIDMVQARLMVGKGWEPVVRFGALGRITAQDWADRVISSIPVFGLVRWALRRRKAILPAWGWFLGLNMLRRPMLLRRRWGCGLLAKAAMRGALRQGAGKGVVADTHGSRLADIRAAAAMGKADRAALSFGSPIWGRGERAGRGDVPILFYRDVGNGTAGGNPVSPALFAGQLRWLRDNGYQAIGLRELAGPAKPGGSWPARPVILAFDGGDLRGFAEKRLPALKEYGLFGEIFIATGENGGSGGDSHPVTEKRKGVAALMMQGMRVGSGLVTGLPIDGLSTEELARELALSASVLERWTGTRPMSFAAPHAISDERLASLAFELGYGAGLGAGRGTVRTGCRMTDLPRIEVSGDASLKDFIAEMESLP